jgi:hypothetical protein
VRRPQTLLSAALLSALAAAPGAASAQEQAPTPAGVGGQNQPNASDGGQAFADPSQLFSGQAGAFFGVGIGKIDGDVYATTLLNTDFSVGPVGVGLGLPVHLLVRNDASTGTRESKAYGGVVRRRDFDQFENYLRVVRYLRYGHKRDELYVLAGQQWGSSIGHGTLVNRYNNTLNLDRAKFGLALDVNTIWFGVETLADSIVDPALLASRAYVRPLGDVPYFRGWAVGATVAVDRAAPRSLATATSASGQRVLQVDEHGAPVVALGEATYAAGIDTEFEVVHNSMLSLIPYVDLNRLLGAGNGLHTGVLVDVRIPVPVLDIDLQARLEYRRLQAGYLPEYFDQQYDLARYQFALRTSTPAGMVTTYQPKATAARELHRTGGGAKNGYYGELAFNFAGLVQVGGVLQGYEGENGSSLGLFATLPRFQTFKLSGYYLRNNFNGFRDAFTLDERSLLAFAAAYNIAGPLYFRADFTRQWQLLPNRPRIEAVDRYNVGLALFVTL